MRLAITLVLAFLLVPVAVAQDGWTAADTAREAAFVGLTFMDWQGTRWALYETEGRFHEANPVLGSRPSKTKLDVMVAGAVVGHAAVSYLLPDPYRRWWQYAFIAVETSAVANNANLAGGFRFSF